MGRYVSQLKEYIEEQKSEIMAELLNKEQTLDDISREHLNARYQALLDIEGICIQRGRY